MTPDAELLAIFKAEVGQQLAELGELLGRAPADWAVDQALHLAHNVKGAARTVGAAPLVEVAHALEDLFGGLSATPEPGPDGVRLVREGARLLEDCFESLDRGAPPNTGDYRAAVAAFLDAGGEGQAPASAVVLPIPARGPREDPAPIGEAATSSETIRVTVARLDALAELAAELATSVQRGEEQWDRAAQLAGQLRDAVRMLRMVPIDTVRGLLSKTLRDACADAGRAADLKVDGEQTEIDRAVLDQLRSPLVHLVRNAVAHGIEPEARRVSAGKPPRGKVQLRARSLGGWVEITVADDGRGVDPRVIARRAVSLGLLTPADAGRTPDHELLDLVFHPGFSTAEGVSELAGRGVGLDIVRSAAAGLGGTVSLSSAPGQGAELRLRVPLTRLTMSGILVRTSDQLFAFPADAVERTQQVDEAEVRCVDGVEVVAVQGALTPIDDLATVLGIPARAEPPLAAVIVAFGGPRRALRVDEVLGLTELTVQPLPWNVGHLPCVSTTAVLGSSEVVLVLNPQELLADRERRATKSIATPAERRRPRILVADDSVTSRTLEKNILTAAGFEVLVAADGEQAFELARTNPVDLLISDVDMPRLGGLDLTRRIRQTKGLERLPILLITSLGSEEDKQRGAEAGADAYIVKGAFDQDTLLRAVGRLV